MEGLGKMEQEKQRCRKCLTREFDKNQIYQNMYEYIANLDKDKKADSTLYENRLSVCKQCERLMDGLCNACGCFVEMRAAMVNNRCPYKKW